MSENTGKNYLESLLNRKLHCTVTDGRVFQGILMCTDRDGSAILNDTWEYRPASSPSLHESTACASTGAMAGSDADAAGRSVRNGAADVSEKRFVGLVVVPGKHTTRVRLVNDDAAYS